MTRTDRIEGAVSVALERARAALDTVSGLRGVRIEIKLDNDGNPSRAILYPEFEFSIVTRKIGDYKFGETTQ